MTNCFLIYPTQLFKNNSHLDKMDAIYLIEEPFYFTSKKFHKQKLIFHRASMKCYYDKLKLKYKNVHYLEFNQINYKEIFKSNVHIFDPIDKPIINFLISHKPSNKDLFVYDSPAFIETVDELTEYRNKFTNKKNYYHDKSFYRWQRKKLNLLMNADKPDEPDGGEWSYDKENRKPYDSKYKEPKIKTYNNKYIKEAEAYINKHFKDNFGLVGDFYYPISHEETLEHLKRFIDERLETFGKYEDGISKKVVFGSHSVLSPMLNIGLITPEIIIDQVMKYYKSNLSKEALINVEAFIRQLIGWRSYMRFIYHFHGDSMISDNLFKSNKNKLPSSWYSQTTNIGIIDDMIYKAKKYAYLHHIERLMVMGNFAFICQIKPSDIYDWFMICFIDAYEWVMIPNVYGMSQYALTSISMMTKPYLSSSNYIKKMSDYKKEGWFPIWDALYWNFINTNKETLKKIYGTAFQVKLIEKMDKKKLEDYQKIAKQYLN
jgi:deoxyribodipyrimidine photolyase-related protein